MADQLAILRMIMAVLVAKNIYFKTISAIAVMVFKVENNGWPIGNLPAKLTILLPISSVV